jgi:hypothetical protein
VAASRSFISLFWLKSIEATSIDPLQNIYFRKKSFSIVASSRSFISLFWLKSIEENEAALKSADSDAQLRRFPSAKMVASSTGNQWKEVAPEAKARAEADRKRYEEQAAQ